MNALHDALSHAKNALQQLRAVKAIETTRPGSPAPDPALTNGLLRRALHELTSACEAVRSELGEPVVTIEAQVDQPEKLGDRMTALQQVQFGIEPASAPAPYEDLAAVLAKSILSCESCKAEPRSSGQTEGVKCLARRESWIKAQRALAEREGLAPKREPNQPAGTFRRPAENDLRAPRSLAERDKAESPRP